MLAVLTYLKHKKVTHTTVSRAYILDFTSVQYAYLYNQWRSQKILIGEADFAIVLLW